MHQLRILYARHADAIANVGLGNDWEGFKSALKQIRQQGYSMTVGDYNTGIISIAAPLFNREGEVLGSLSLVASNQNARVEAFRDFAPLVTAAAKEANARIAANEDVVALPARALG
jgi:DNA-binding IclR family transcriptional regulator